MASSIHPPLCTPPPSWTRVRCYGQQGVALLSRDAGGSCGRRLKLGPKHLRRPRRGSGPKRQGSEQRESVRRAHRRRRRVPRAFLRIHQRPQPQKYSQPTRRLRANPGSTRGYVGANATIRCGVTLGAHSFVAAGAVVTDDVPAHALVMGVPAKHSGWMSAHGVQLDFDEHGRATCPESGQSYQLQDNHLLVP